MDDYNEQNPLFHSLIPPHDDQQHNDQLIDNDGQSRESMSSITTSTSLVAPTVSAVVASHQTTSSTIDDISMDPNHPFNSHSTPIDDEDYSMPDLQSLSSLSSSSSSSDNDDDDDGDGDDDSVIEALEVEMQAIQQDGYDTPWMEEENTSTTIEATGSAPHTATAPRRRARVDDDHDEERDRRHPSHRTATSIDNDRSSFPPISATPTPTTSSPTPARTPAPIPPTPQQEPPQPPRPTTNPFRRTQGISIPIPPNGGFVQHTFRIHHPNAEQNETPNGNPQNDPDNQRPWIENMGGFAITFDMAGGPVLLPNPADDNLDPDAAGNDRENRPQDQPHPTPPGMFADVNAFRHFLGLFGNTLSFNIEREQEDPERAKRLVDGLEEVPVGLIRRLERIGGTSGPLGNDGNPREEGATGGDSGCAICWDRLLDGEGEGFGRDGETGENSGSSSDEGVTSQPLPGESSQPSSTEQATHPKIVSLPCAHVFHASCLIPWFSRPRQTTCPTCRFNIDPENLTYSRRRMTRRADGNGDNNNDNNGSGPVGNAEDGAAGFGEQPQAGDGLNAENANAQGAAGGAQVNHLNVNVNVNVTTSDDNEDNADNNNVNVNVAQGIEIPINVIAVGGDETGGGEDGEDGEDGEGETGEMDPRAEEGINAVMRIVDMLRGVLGALRLAVNAPTISRVVADNIVDSNTTSPTNPPTTSTPNNSSSSPPPNPLPRFDLEAAQVSITRGEAAVLAAEFAVQLMRMRQGDGLVRLIEVMHAGAEVVSVLDQLRGHVMAYTAAARARGVDLGAIERLGEAVTAMVNGDEDEEGEGEGEGEGNGGVGHTGGNFDAMGMLDEEEVVLPIPIGLPVFETFNPMAAAGFSTILGTPTPTATPPTQAQTQTPTPGRPVTDDRDANASNVRPTPTPTPAPTATATRVPNSIPNPNPNPNPNSGAVPTPGQGGPGPNGFGFLTVGFDVIFAGVPPPPPMNGNGQGGNNNVGAGAGAGPGQGMDVDVDVDGDGDGDGAPNQRGGRGRGGEERRTLAEEIRQMFSDAMAASVQNLNGNGPQFGGVGRGAAGPGPGAGGMQIPFPPLPTFLPFPRPPAPTTRPTQTPPPSVATNNNNPNGAGNIPTPPNNNNPNNNNNNNHQPNIPPRPFGMPAMNLGNGVHIVAGAGRTLDEALASLGGAAIFQGQMPTPPPPPPPQQQQQQPQQQQRMQQQMQQQQRMQQQQQRMQQQMQQQQRMQQQTQQQQRMQQQTQQQQQMPQAQQQQQQQGWTGPFLGRNVNVMLDAFRARAQNSGPGPAPAPAFVNTGGAQQTGLGGAPPPLNQSGTGMGASGTNPNPNANRMPFGAAAAGGGGGGGWQHFAFGTGAPPPLGVPPPLQPQQQPQQPRTQPQQPQPQPQGQPGRQAGVPPPFSNLFGIPFMSQGLGPMHNPFMRTGTRRAGPPRERKTWTPPPAPGPTLRQRIEKKELEAGLRCHDLSCGVGPSDEEPFTALSIEAKKQLSLWPGPRDHHQIGTASPPVCGHRFHSPCLVSSERVRVALMGEEVPVLGEDVEVSCSVCRGVGFVTREDWDEGVKALA